MKINPETLTAEGYVLLDKLEHNELVPFVQTYIKKKTTYSAFYNVATFVFLAAVGYLFVAGLKSSDYNFGDRLTHFSYGFAFAFLLLPLHEYIHVLAYKSQGAKNTSYAANLKKFYFMALADKFVANKKEFETIALAPFSVITLVSLALLFVVPTNWAMTVVAMLFAHTAMCSGDFALMSYFEFHQDKTVVTYDDVEHKISYFYAQIRADDDL